MEINNELIPIFITGAPRSGTTMLASVIASRTDAIAINEMHYIHDLLRIQIENGKVEEALQLQVLKKSNFIKKLDLFKGENDIKQIINIDFRLTINNILESANNKFFKKEKIRYWVEHTPHNHVYYDVFMKAYPNCKFVHIVRDGRAVFNSTKNIRWGLKDVVSGAISWKKQVSNCKSLESNSNFYTIRYEDFILDQDNNLRKLCDFLKMEFQEEMFEANGLNYTNELKKNHSKSIGEKPNKESLVKWKSSLSQGEISHFSAYNEELLRYYGYEIESNKMYNPIKKVMVFGLGMSNYIISRIIRKILK